MAKPRLLTKSRFKVAVECPTKLYYLDHAAYGNKNLDDGFLKALAEGGFQVGELAKIYHPEGLEIREKDYERSLAETTKHLASDKVTLFEAAIRYKNLYARIDVLKKRGHTLEIIEVKAKSFDRTEEEPFFTRKKSLRSEWEKYLLDVAFQTYIVMKAFPAAAVSSYLMLADKSALATVDGVNQAFLIQRDASGRSQVKVRQGTSKASLGAPLLCRVDVGEAVQHILHEKYGDFGKWESYISELEDLVTQHKKAPPKLSANCKHCEFRIDPKKFPQDTKNGYLECWQATGLTGLTCDKPMVFDIWNFRQSQEIIETRRYFMDQVTEEDIKPAPSGKPGLSSSQRQWLQVQMSSKSKPEAYFDAEGLKAEIQSWKFPLHFIDFETTMTALPFHKGRRPYETIAFQFSHHTLQSPGHYAHKSQFIHRERGQFPNVQFVRELKQALSSDEGTILRYSHHENTVLCQILEQIMAAKASVPDAEELIAWIKTVTTSSGDRGLWSGNRTMVDMCDLVKKYYYSPHTNGSNSIKKVLPAILKDSAFLAEKYSQPIYGTAGIPSLNYSQWAWLKRDSAGHMIDPYKLLPPIFSEEELEKIEPLVNASEIADGGAAMMAYAFMQFTEMTDSETIKIQDALLKYCELDTFAMVMIFEHWANLLGLTKSERAA